MSFDSRQAALDTLNRLDSVKSTLDSVLEKIIPEDADISRRDRALFQTIVFGVLRWRGRLDFVIKYFSKTRFNRIDPCVVNILRLGLFQIIYLDRVPESAAVNTAVELAKANVAPWLAGFVNGLLRNAAREYQNLPFPGVEENAISSTATTRSFPEWIIRRWVNRWGLATATALCDDLNAIPAITVRTNRLKASRPDLLQSQESRDDTPFTGRD